MCKFIEFDNVNLFDFYKILFVCLFLVVLVVIVVIIVLVDFDFYGFYVMDKNNEIL